MLLPKNTPYRNRKLLDEAEGRACIRCKREDGTTVAAHYCGLYANRLGRGGKVKAHDFAAAWLCSACHSEFDTYAQGNNAERAAEFLTLILETQTILFREDKLMFKGR